MDKRPLVVITWTDAKGVTDYWDDIEDPDELKPCQCLTVGFLMEDFANWKVLAQSITETEVLGRMCIPSASIISITTLDSSGIPSEINRSR